MLLRANTSPRQAGDSRQAEEFAPAAPVSRLACDRSRASRSSRTCLQCFQWGAHARCNENTGLRTRLCRNLAEAAVARDFLRKRLPLLLAENALAPHNASYTAGPVWTPLRNIAVLTESEVSRSWNKLFKSGAFTEATFERAEALLDELRGTSPLRHRLQAELEELRELHGAQVEA
jgi:hypothetical protein